MFLDTPEKRLRMFVSTPESEMWYNTPQELLGGAPLSIAFHSHHCNITLETLTGEIKNWQVRAGNFGHPLYKFTYDSKLIGTGNGFKNAGLGAIETRSIHTLVAGESEYMDAQAVHTVSVPRNTYAAWLVYEGREDPDYNPTTWSNHDLEQISLEGLYTRPTLSDFDELLRIAGI
jgi:hypothetical protein